jgi:multiple sugar transport system substrate-binding protein
MLKRILFCTAVMVFVLFAACGSKTASESSGSSAIVVNNQLVGRADAPIEITFQPDPGHWLSSTDPRVAAYFEKKARAWAEAHPDVKIVPVAQSVNIGDSMGKLLIQAADGNAPDLAEVDSFVLPNFKQYLQPLDDVLSEKGIDKASWFPFAQEGMNYNGKYVALWHTTDVRVLYYNKTLVPNPPTTWDQLFAMGADLKDKGYTPLLYPAGRNETTSCDILPWFWSQGGNLVDNAGNPVFNEGNNRNYLLNTLAFLKRTIDTGISPARVTTFGTDSDMNNEVVAGKVAMFVGGSWLSSQLRSIMGDKEFSDTWGLAQIPMPSGGKRVSTAGGWTVAVFSKDDQKRKLAADFGISLYIADEAMDEYSAVSGNLPCRSTIYEKSEYFKNDPVLVAYANELEYARVRPGVEIYPVISQEFQVAISDVITGAATPEAALSAMARNVSN